MSWYADPCESQDIMPFLHLCEIVTLRSSGQDGRSILSDRDMEYVFSLNIDVVLNLGKDSVPQALFNIPRYGVWSAGTTIDGVPRGGPHGFWEVMNREHTTEVSVRMSTGQCNNAKILTRFWTSTDIYSVKGNRSKVLWKSSPTIVRKLHDLYQRGLAALAEDNGSAAKSDHRGDACQEPTNATMTSFLIKTGARRISRRLWNSVYLEQWSLAYRFGKPVNPVEGYIDIKVIKPPPDRFWADPFPIERSGKYYIFLEEFPYQAKKGHISVMEIDEGGKWTGPKKVLDTPYHLSYPFLLEWNDELYMIPETKRNKTIEAYRCVEFPLKWELHKVMMPEVQAVDSTLHEMNGVWWLFCNIGGSEFSSNDELHLFFSETPFGPWTPHPRNPVKSDARSARPAGRLFEWQGNLYRPSQDCSERMGGAICINRVLCMNMEDFREELVGRIDPTWARGMWGTHTLNTAGNLTMLDCFGYVRKYFP